MLSVRAGCHEALVMLPRSVPAEAAAAPRAAVLLLPGGRADGLGPPSRWNLPAARMRPFARAIARATAGDDVLLAAVRYRHRGWNGSRGDTVRDVRRALAELEDLAGPVPVVLVGHSMGGRAALHAAGHPLVRAVVGLAPWCPPGEPVAQLDGKRVVLLHGTRDRTTDPAASRDVARRARAAGAEAVWVPVSGGDHAMLRRASTWHSLTADSVAGLLESGPLPQVVREALSWQGTPGLPEVGRADEAREAGAVDEADEAGGVAEAP